MSETDPVPRAAQPFLSFVSLLRPNGFAVAPEQTTSFLAAIALLGPRDPEDVRQAGLATLAPPPERRAAYDLLFRIHFLGEEAPTPGETDSEEPVKVQDEQGRRWSRPTPTKSTRRARRRRAPKPSSGAASARRRTSDPLRRLAREAQRRLPRRKSYRRMRARRGATVDLRRTLRDSRAQRRRGRAAREPQAAPAAAQDPRSSSTSPAR